MRRTFFMALALLIPCAMARPSRATSRMRRSAATKRPCAP